jgi:hypothetical protein
MFDGVESVHPAVIDARSSSTNILEFIILLVVWPKRFASGDGIFKGRPADLHRNLLEMG